MDFDVYVFFFIIVLRRVNILQVALERSSLKKKKTYIIFKKCIYVRGIFESDACVYAGYAHDNQLVKIERQRIVGGLS